MVLAVDSDSDLDIPATQPDAEELEEEALMGSLVLEEEPAEKPVMTAVKGVPTKKPAEPAATAKVALGTAAPVVPKCSSELAAMQEQYALLKAQMEMMQRQMGDHWAAATPEPQKPIFSPPPPLAKGVSEASVVSPAAVKPPAPLPPAGLDAPGTSVAGPPPKTGAPSPPIFPTPPPVPKAPAPEALSPAASVQEQELVNKFSTLKTRTSIDQRVDLSFMCHMHVIFLGTFACRS